MAITTSFMLFLFKFATQVDTEVQLTSVSEALEEWEKLIAM